MDSMSQRFNGYAFVHGRVRLLCLALLGVAFALQATAELTQVQVGGELRTRGRYYINAWQPGGRATRIPNEHLRGRPIGWRGTDSLFKWDSRGSDWTMYETCLLLNVKADFTDDVSAFIELYDRFVWGTQFRSNYLTGEDRRGNGNVTMHQGYVEMRQLLDKPLRLRVGRQELLFGRGWLVSNMLTPSQYISHDAFRLTYDANDLTVDAFASKLAENTFQDDSDIDFYGVYGTYSGLDAVNLSLYWFFVRDATEIPRFETTQLGRWVNTQLGYDYSSTKLHFLGTRLFGRSGGFDYDLELAYQFGDASHMGSLFRPVGSLFGDPSARYDHWAAELMIGYTFQDVAWQPRVYVHGVFFEGQDNRNISFWDWMNPFYRPKASVSFNRLFSDKNYMPTVNDNSWLSNFYQANIGLEVQPTPKLRLHAHVAKNWVHKPFDPPKSIRFGGRRIPVAPALSFWTDKGSNNIGWEVAAWARYVYSDNLWFLLYGNYLWAGSGLTDGAFMHFYGTEFSGGSSDKNAGYVFWMAVLEF